MLCRLVLALGQEAFTEFMRSVSIGKLRTYSLYERVKVRFHLPKLNSDTLRKAVPKLYQRIQAGDEDFAADVAQVILVAHLDMVCDVLDLLSIPHNNGFLSSKTDVAARLTPGWQQRVLDQLRGKYPERLLIFYLNYLAWENLKTEEVFQPAPAAAG